jgi:hypothetical protein
MDPIENFIHHVLPHNVRSVFDSHLCAFELQGHEQAPRFSFSTSIRIAEGAGPGANLKSGMKRHVYAETMRASFEREKALAGARPVPTRRRYPPAHNNVRTASIDSSISIRSKSFPYLLTDREAVLCQYSGDMPDTGSA